MQIPIDRPNPQVEKIVRFQYCLPVLFFSRLPKSAFFFQLRQGKSLQKGCRPWRHAEHDLSSPHEKNHREERT